MKKMLDYLMGNNQARNQSAQKIKIGVCAMDKKAKSKQMNNIIARIMSFGEFEMVMWGDEVILNTPVEEWPLCDYLLSWHSDGFPLAKAQAYIKLRNVPTMNDLEMQTLLQDRRHMYLTLVKHNIPTATHIIVDRQGLEPGQDPEGFVEDEDYVEMNGQKINKPFVEKPFDGDDHNVYIYYPSSMGGGVKRLFRKIDNKSSQYDKDHPGTVRRDGSYIIEEFLPTGGTDVKVYTVGTRYAHAEARKSPVVDGKVQRTADGKEMRFPVLLSPMEKDIASLVVYAFRQRICGFDLLRSEKGRVVVCDVNGWSFVKNSTKYYDDAAGIIRNIVLTAVAPMRLAANPEPQVLDSLMRRSSTRSTGVPPNSSGLEGTEATIEEEEEEEALDENMKELVADELAHTDQRSRNEELRCVLAIIRHGDRTPKQKLKVKVTAEPLLALFMKHKDKQAKQAKLKTPLQLQELLDTTREQLLAMEKPENNANLSDDERDQQTELREKLRIVKTVLEQAAFNGINRKVQLKPTRWRQAQQSSAADEGTGGSILLPTHSGSQQQLMGSSPADHLTAAGAAAAAEEGGVGSAIVVPPSPKAPRTTLTDMMEHAGNKSGGGSSSNTAEGSGVLEEALLILKWGGVLTHAGRQQAEDLGRMFRMVMYPRSGSGGGLLRLHSTYRHDLKIYSSDEGRVQVSAAAFAKGLLDLEGSSLTPILVSLVNKDASMLEAFGKGASDNIENAKDLIYTAMTYDPDKPKGTSPIDMTPPVSPGRPLPLAHITARSSTHLMGASAHSSVTSMPDLIPQPSTDVGGTRCASPLGVSPSVPPIGVLYPWKEDPTGAFQEASKLKFFPKEPRKLLLKLHELMKGLVGSLRTLCLQPPPPPSGTAGENTAPNFRYSSLSLDPSEWQLIPDKPCGGEQTLLMFDRWNKLFKGFYSEKKDKFDISKIPDIYDSAKYDAIHNRHLVKEDDPVLRSLYEVARELAGAVIPSEYGTDPSGKLTIGSKICGELLGKLLTDMATMRDESKTIKTGGANTPRVASESKHPPILHASSISNAVAAASARLLKQQEEDKKKQSSGSKHPNPLVATAAEGAEDLPNPFTTECKIPTGDLGGDAGAGGAGEEEEEDDEGPAEDAEHEVNIHRLAPDFATHINSPMRHVRTRIYFTSESHIHSLVNVLRFAHMHPLNNVPPGPDGMGGVSHSSVLNLEGMEMLDNTAELDYLTHVVIRMYESRDVPIDSPDRFRIEILFSPGANYNPFEISIEEDHTLPPVPRVHMEDKEDGGITLADLEELLRPMAKTSKFQVSHSSYTLQTAGGMGTSKASSTRGSSIAGVGSTSINSNNKTSTAGASRLGRAE